MLLLRAGAALRCSQSRCLAWALREARPAHVAACSSRFAGTAQVDALAREETVATPPPESASLPPVDFASVSGGESTAAAGRAARCLFSEPLLQVSMRMDPLPLAAPDRRARPVCCA